MFKKGTKNGTGNPHFCSSATHIPSASVELSGCSLSDGHLTITFAFAEALTTYSQARSSSLYSETLFC